MKDVLVTGLFVLAAAIVSGWALEGGIHRRVRRTLLEELDLLERIGRDSADGRRLQAKVDRRMDGYLTPWSEKVRGFNWPQRTVWAALSSIGLGSAVAGLIAALQDVDIDGDRVAQGVGVAAAATAYATLIGVFLQVGVVGATESLTRLLAHQSEFIAGVVAKYMQLVARLVAVMGEFAAKVMTTLMYGRRGRKRNGGSDPDQDG